METLRLGMKKYLILKLKVGYSFFLKHILHHPILAAAFGTKINLKMLKTLLVSDIFHIEIMMYMRKNTIVSILGNTLYLENEEQHAHIRF